MKKNKKYRKESKNRKRKKKVILYYQRIYVSPVPKEQEKRAGRINIWRCKFDLQSHPLNKRIVSPITPAKTNLSWQVATGQGANILLWSWVYANQTDIFTWSQAIPWSTPRVFHSQEESAWFFSKLLSLCV